MRGVALGGAVLLAVASGAVAAPPELPVPNAALQYWQAFATLPGPKGLGDKLTEEEQKRLDEWETAPLDETAASAIKKHADALTYLHRGAAIPDCTWASQFDNLRDGVGTRCPQVARSHDLRHAAILRARYRFAHGQPRRALDDLFALVRFARHLEKGSTLVGVLVSYAIERDVIRVFAANMWALAPHAELLTAARHGWDKLPPARPVTDALNDERAGLVGMLRHAAGVDAKNPPDDELATPIGFVPTIAFLLGRETYPQAVATLCNTVGRHYDRLIQATDVRPEQIAAAEQAFFANWGKQTRNEDAIAVEVTRQLLPAAAKLRLTEAEMFTRRAMLRAAFAVAAEGQDKLKAHTDPFGNAAFKTERVEGGYELMSELGKVLDKPVTLAVRTARPKD